MSEIDAASRQTTPRPGDRGSAALGNGTRFMTLKRVAMAAAT
jgi:hypothetical protein